LECLESRDLPAPLTWSAGVSLPTARAGVVAVQASNQFTVILGGSSGEILVPTFAAANPAWQTTIGYTTPLDQPRVSAGAGVLADGNLLLFGGQNTEGDPLSSAYDFGGNPANVASMKNARYQFGYATDENHLVYAIGGVGDSGTLSSVEVFNQATNTWTTLASLPKPLSSLSAVADGAGHIFAFGGLDSNGNLSSAVYRYTIATNKWDPMASLPVATDNTAAVLGSNGLIYVLGGLTNSGTTIQTTANVESYNETTNSWTAQTALPSPVSSEAATVDSLGRIVVAGGFDVNGTATQSVYVSQQLDLPDSAPTITSSPAGVAYANLVYSYQVLSTGNPESTYSLTTEPAGMTIDPNTGLISWTATSSQVGSYTVTVQASNYAGSTTQTYTLSVVPSAPTGLTAKGASTSSIALSWNPVYDPAGVTYNITEQKWVSNGGGKGSHGGHYVYTGIASGVTTTSYTVGGLTTGSSHTYYITAVDKATSIQTAPSAVATGQTWIAPTLSQFVLWGGAVFDTVPVTSGQSVQVSMISTGNPAPSYAITSGPSTITVDANGVVTYTPGPTESGIVSYTVQASNSAGSVSQTYSFQVRPAPTIIFNDGPFTFNGYAFYATATAVASDGVTPVNGTFTYSYSGPSNPPSFAGTYTVTANFTSSDSVYGSTTATSTMIINPALAVFSQLQSPLIAAGTPSVTLSGYLTAGALAPASGTIDVTLNGVTQQADLGAGDYFSSTFDTSSLAPGTYSVSYSYLPGDPDFTAQDGTSTLYVGAGVTGSLSSSAPFSAKGQGVTLTATFAAGISGAATPTGTVTFLDGTTVLGTASLDSGTAAITASSLAVGVHSISASYSGDATYGGTTSNSIVQTVGGTTTTLVSSSDPSVYGQKVSLTGAVTAEAAGSGTPTGTVTFFDGSTVLGSATLNMAGKAVFTTTAFALPLGDDSITAAYNGSASFMAGTSAALDQTVNEDTTTTQITSSANASVFGQKVTFTAAVAAQAPGSGTPTGTATFMDGTTILGTATLASGKATFSTTTLALGGHSIAVSYSGNTNFVSSTSAPLIQNVNQDTTTTKVTSSIDPSVVGQTVIFTGTVAANAPGSTIPTGTVTFFDGTITLATVALVSGKATYSTHALSQGSHSISVGYNGDTNFIASSSSTLTQTINRDGTKSVVTSSASTAVVGQNVTFTATITALSPGSGTPTGTVTFYDGTTQIGTGTLNGTGKATFATTSLALGSHAISIVYAGDASYTTSTSAVVNLTINPAATTTTVSPSANPSVFGQGVTFTAVVTAKAPGSGKPTGTVTFMDGTTALGTGTLDGTGHATFTTSALAVGSHSITVVYAGDGNYAASTSTALAQKVNKANTAATVVSSLNPASQGTPITFTAAVLATAPGAGIPTGTVTFYDGTTILGTATLDGTGHAILTTSWATAGSHSITVKYGGDSNFNTSTTAVLTQTVN
jgi:hypothetical protein